MQKNDTMQMKKKASGGAKEEVSPIRTVIGTWSEEEEGGEEKEVGIVPVFSNWLGLCVCGWRNRLLAGRWRDCDGAVSWRQSSIACATQL